MIEITDELTRRLIDSQFPEWRNLDNIRNLNEFAEDLVKFLKELEEILLFMIRKQGRSSKSFPTQTIKSCLLKYGSFLLRQNTRRSRCGCMVTLQ